VEICRHKLTPAHFQRAVNTAEPFTPDTAVQAGFLDEVIAERELPATAKATGERLAGINLTAHAATKLRTREHTLTALRAAIEADHAEFLAGV
jgi:enoyl-CoA hydratase